MAFPWEYCFRNPEVFPTGSGGIGKGTERNALEITMVPAGNQPFYARMTVVFFFMVEKSTLNLKARFFPNDGEVMISEYLI